MHWVSISVCLHLSLPRQCSAQLMLMVPSDLETSVGSVSTDLLIMLICVFMQAHTGLLRGYVSLHEHHVLDIRLGLTMGRCMYICAWHLSSTIRVGAYGFLGPYLLGCSQGDVIP